MVASLVLLTLTPAAPVPKDPPPPPPPIAVGAKRYVYPPRDVGGGKFVTVDDGHFVEVTIQNVSQDTLSFDSRHELGDLVHMKVTDAKGTQLSEFGYHLMLLCSSRSHPVELKPGASVKVIAHLMQDWKWETRGKPGKYTVRAEFKSGKIKAESAAAFEIEFPK